MARPVKYDTEQLVETAIRLAAESGPTAVTMSAVAEATGAPSGSMYHRFAGRPALLAEVWLRCVESFQHGYVEALDTSDDPLEGAVAAARHVVEWSRANPAYTAVLLYPARDFGAADWPEWARERLETDNRRAIGAVRATAKRLGARSVLDQDRVTVALLDVPYGLVRRHLRAGGIPKHAAGLAEETVRALLTAID